MKIIIVAILAIAGMASGQEDVVTLPQYGATEPGQILRIDPAYGQFRNLTTEEYKQIYGISIYTKEDAKEIVTALDFAVNINDMLLRTHKASMIDSDLKMCQKTTDYLLHLRNKWHKRLEEMK